jgi:transposase, IS30 family
MDNTYKQVSLSERVEIYRMKKEGRTARAIARALGRAPSTITRELRRNSRSTKSWSDGYDPVRADALRARRRAWDARFKLARDGALREHVHERLKAGWSPEEIAGDLRRAHGRCIISHEAIYRFIYHRSAQKDYHWHRLLPMRKSRRGRLGMHGGSPVEHIRERISIHERPQEVDSRTSPGHWEGDLMLFARYGQAILITHERKSRLLLGRRQPSKAAAPVASELKRQFRSLPAALRRTLTIDNGTEFAYHYQLRDELGIDTYFCDPHAPWQKGGIENAIGRLRRRLPRKADLATLAQLELVALVESYNTTPRKCLAFRTPHEIFSKAINRVAPQP